MELYLQLGHGMQTLSQELIKSWGKGNVIISPVNLQQDKLASFANKIHTCGGQVLFDPQMFYPKEGHIKLQAYDYWPSRGISITSQSGYETINRELLRINNEINSSHIILPGIEMQENQFHYGLDCMNQSAAYLSQKTDKRRINYYNYYTGKKWGSPENYHIMMDSSVLGIEGTAQALAAIIKNRYGI